MCEVSKPGHAAPITVAGRMAPRATHKTQCMNRHTPFHSLADGHCHKAPANQRQCSSGGILAAQPGQRALVGIGCELASWVFRCAGRCCTLPPARVPQHCAHQPPTNQRQVGRMRYRDVVQVPQNVDRVSWQGARRAACHGGGGSGGSGGSVGGVPPPHRWLL